jgi:hypothetical protein
MTCGLIDPELDILNILYGQRCLGRNRSFNLGTIAKKFRAKHNADPNEVAKDLENKKYLGSVPKNAIKY